MGLGGYLRKENGEEQGENDNADNTNGNGNGNGNSNGGSNGGGVSESIISEKRDGKSAKDKGYSLRDWFKGGGWKQTGGKYDGKPCAKQPGQTTKPYCRDADDRAAMSKDRRDKEAAKKRKEDPNPNRTGKAKMVTQNNSFEPEANIVEEEKKKKRDACYHKVKSRYSIWPSAYASGALVKCRKVGAANWGNKSEEMDYTSFADRAKKTLEKNKKKALKGETKTTTTKEEWIVDNAAHYFFNEGINEEGLVIFIEELGVENFVEFVHDLAEDSELIEAYALTDKKKTPKRLPKGTQPAKTTKATIARGDRTIKAASPSGAFKKRPAAEKAVETAKKQQPKKRPVLDGIARQVLKGMNRHNKAMERAKQDIKTTKKIAAKIGTGAKEFGKGVRTGLNTTRKFAKVAKKAVSESVQYSDWRDDFKAMEYEFIDLIKPEPLVSEGAMPDPIDSKKHRDASRQSKINNMKRSDNPNEREVANKKLTPAAKVDTPLTLANKTIGFSKNTAPKEKPRGPKLMGEGKYSDSETYVRGTAPVRDPQTGESYPKETYKKKSKKVKEEVETISERGPHGRTKSSSRTGSSSEKPQRRLKSRRFERFGNPGRSDYLKARRAELDRMGVAANHADAPLVDEAKVETIDEAGKKCWKGYKKAGTQKLFGKTYNRCVKANEEFVDEAKDETEIGITGLPIPKKKRSPKKQYEFEKARRKNLGTNVGGKTYKKDVTPYYNPRVKEEVESDWRSEIEEGAAWTKKSGKNPSGGLNEKGRKSYERENPGSDLKRPSKKKGNKRRASFCARMKGMKKKLTSSKTANDPDSRINKSLRAWNC